jgi:hypothetical protein
MIPTETGPAGGHSLYCLATNDGFLLSEDIFWDFSIAIQAAVEQSGSHELWTEQVLVVGFPPCPVVPPPNIQDMGQVAAIVLRKVVFSPATGQALEPTIHPTPWGELQDRIAAQNKMITGLQTSLSQTLELMTSALEQVHLIDAPGVPGEIGWNVYPQIQALETLTTTVKEIDCPF